jgi:hypothetical protein
MVLFLSFVLASVGLTVLIVWPTNGPGALLREKVLRQLLPHRSRSVLDCYICFGFWTGLALGAVWWALFEAAWAWFGCLMIPAVFWLVMLRSNAAEARPSHDEGPP